MYHLSPFIIILFCLIKIGLGFEVVYLADHAVGASNGPNIYYYDNYHTIPFQNLKINPSNPSFTITGKMDTGGIGQSYLNIFQIYNQNSPDQKIIMIGYLHSTQEVFIRQQSASNTFQGQNKCSVRSGSFYTPQVEFIVSLQRVGTTTNYEFYMRFLGSNICQFSQSIPSAIDWFSGVQILQFSNSAPSGVTPAEYPLKNGSVHRVFLIRDFYYQNSIIQLRNFILSISQYSQEALSFFKSNKFSSITNCILDESVKREGCSTSNSWPTVDFGQGQFKNSQNLQILQYNTKRFFYHYDKFITPFFFTFSHWFYLDSNNGNFNIVTIWNMSYNSQTVLSAVFVKDNVDSTKYILKIIYNNNISQTVATLSVQKYYYLVFTYNKYSKTTITVVIIDDQGSLQDFTYIFTIPYILFEYADLKIGDIDSKLDTNFYYISQYNFYLSGSILYDQQFVNSIVSNCQLLVFRRMSFECVVCKKGYYLFQNQCQSSCNINIYTQSNNYRSCIKKCSYKCSTCDSNTPDICLECSSFDRDILNNCNCKIGYDDYMSSKCPLYKKLGETHEYDFIDFAIFGFIPTTDFIISLKMTYKNPPFIIFSVQQFTGTKQIKGIQTEIKDITNTSFTISLRGSYTGSVYDDTTFNSQYMVITSDTTKFHSQFLEFITPSQGVYSKAISTGKYDSTKYGEYKVLTFLSGVYVGDDNAYVSCHSSFKITVNQQKTQISVQVNNKVKLIQVTYLIMPANIPNFTQDLTLPVASSFYQDNSSSYISKTHQSTATILNSFREPDEAYKFKPFYGFNGLDIDFQFTNFLKFFMSYLLIPNNNPNEVMVRLAVEGYSLFQYSGNGFYMIETFDVDKELCQVRDFYTQSCNICKNDLLIPGFDCGYALVNLSITMPTTFETITIDFGEEIELIGNIYLYPSYEICEFLFETDTLTLLTIETSCEHDKQYIILYLSPNANIFKDDEIKFKETLKYRKYSQPIKQFGQNKVKQIPLPFLADAIILYQPILTTCTPVIIQIKQFLNLQKRPIKNFQWSLQSLTPFNLQIQSMIDQIIQDANNIKNLNIIIPRSILLVNMNLQIKLKYDYKIGISGEKTISIDIKEIKLLQVLSKQLTEGPFYKKDELEVFFEIDLAECDQNGIFSQDYKSSFNIIIEEKTLQLSKTLNAFADRAFSFKIPKYLTSVNTVYDVKAQFVVVENNLIKLDVHHYVSIDQVPIIAYINGGNRLHDYNQKLDLYSIVKDLDLDPNQNLPHGITIVWSCNDIQKQDKCQDIENKIIPVPQNLETISFDPLTFIPFTTMQFTLQGAKNTRSAKSTVSISFTDTSIPPVQIIFKDKMILEQTINMNDIIEATIEYDALEDVNLLFFGGSIIYEKKVQASMKFEYGKVRFQFWNYFSDFKTNNSRILVRFNVYNPKYSVPSQSIVIYELNFPPQECKLLSKTNTGQSLQTVFSFIVTECEDPDQPISYKYFYYQSSQDFEFEKKNPLLIQRKQITDQTYQSAVETYLPPGNLLLLVQVFDSKNAIFNMTRSITVTQSIFDEQSYVAKVNELINFANVQTKPIKTLTLSLLSDDIISRFAYYVSLKQQMNNVVKDLKDLSSTEFDGSTFQTLATKSISQIIASSIQDVTYLGVQDHLLFIKDILDQSQSLYTNANQFMKDKINLQIYNSFKSLDTVSGQAKINPQTEQDSILYSQQIGELLNIDALPNESAKVYKGQVINIVSQLITSRNLPLFLNYQVSKNSWEDIQDTKSSFDESLNQVYDVSFKSYNQNLYVQEKQFQDLLSIIKQNKTNFVLNSYKAINPKVSLYESNQQFEMKNQIMHTFTPIKNEDLTCISKVNDVWDRNICKTIFDEKQKFYYCLCDQLSPVTVINDIQNLYSQNENLDTIFSDQGLENIMNFDNFYKYLAFWVITSLTLAFIPLFVYGKYLDNIFLQFFSFELLSSLKQRPNSSSKVVPMEDFMLDTHLIQEIDEKSQPKGKQLNKQNKNPSNSDEAQEIRSKQITAIEPLTLDTIKRIETIQTLNIEENENTKLKQSQKMEIIKEEDLQDGKEVKNQSKSPKSIKKGLNQQKSQLEKKDQSSIFIEDIDKNETPKNTSAPNQIQSNIKITKQLTNKKLIENEKSETIQKSKSKLQNQTSINLQTPEIIPIQEKLIDDKQNQKVFQSPQLDSSLKVYDESTNNFIVNPTSQKVNNQKKQQKKQVEKFKNLKLSKRILYFHDLFSIYLITDPSLGRFTRMLIYYIKNLHIFTSNLVFNKNYSINQIIYLQITNLIAVALVSKCIEFAGRKNNVFKRVVQFIIFGLICFYYYAFLAVVSGDSPDVTNKITLYFFIVLVVDLFATGMLISYLLNFFANKIVNQDQMDPLTFKIFEFINLPLILANL